jgi:hypothetical protein
LHLIENFSWKLIVVLENYKVLVSVWLAVCM